MSIDSRVVMLPAVDVNSYCKPLTTIKGSELLVINLKQPLLDPKYNRMVINQNQLWPRSSFESEGYYKPVHLYIITSEKIVQGDWVYDYAYNEVKVFDKLKVDGGNCSDHCWKIIGTTDKSISLGYGTMFESYVDVIVKEYVTNYNNPEIALLQIVENINIELCS